MAGPVAWGGGVAGYSPRDHLTGSGSSVRCAARGPLSSGCGCGKLPPPHSSHLTPAALWPDNGIPVPSPRRVCPPGLSPALHKAHGPSWASFGTHPGDSVLALGQSVSTQGPSTRAGRAPVVQTQGPEKARPCRPPAPPGEKEGGGESEGCPGFPPPPLPSQPVFTAAHGAPAEPERCAPFASFRSPASGPGGPGQQVRATGVPQEGQRVPPRPFPPPPLPACQVTWPVAAPMGQPRDGGAPLP